MAKYEYWITEEGLIKIEGWARDGLIDEQIASKMNIAPSTLYDWKKKYSEISESLKKGKEVIDRQVENALLKRALGYEYDEITYEEGQETKRVTKQVVPDTTAQIFWLKNRKPAEWRDKQIVESTNEITINNQFKELSTEELKRLAKLDDG
ncbi:transposase [Clostridioides difficile]|nr:transposase [Clostridioides difficile]EIS9458813.1 transposase [Clostridioides difficile]EJX3466226.1 transposase [Clostridioides difficile]EKS6825912.1 transposase [Clostridioides difficile]MBY1915275.1 transposase [Clostridioides difficile]